MSIEPSRALGPHWAAPISLRIGNGHPELIYGPDEALYYIRHHWPVKGSLALDTARRRRLEARIPDMPCGAARDAVIAAAIEARVLA